MEIDCPNCNKTIEIEGEDLPLCACDSIYHECPYCEHEFLIGWRAEIELR